LESKLIFKDSLLAQIGR